MKTKIIIHKGKKYKVIEVLEDYEKIIYRNKEFKIYEWTDEIGKFKYPEGFEISSFQEFNELIEEKKIKLEKYKYYYVKHFNKLFWNKEYCLSGLCLVGLGLVSVDGGLSCSGRGGRVVCVRNLKRN